MVILRDFPYIVWVGNIVTPVVNYVSSAYSRVQGARALLSVTPSIFDLMWFVVKNIIILKVQPLKRQRKNDATIPMVYFDTIPCIQNTGKSTALVFSQEVAVGVTFLVPGADCKSQLSNGYNHCSLMFGCCDDEHGLCIGWYLRC